MKGYSERSLVLVEIQQTLSTNAALEEAQKLGSECKVTLEGFSGWDCDPDRLLSPDCPVRLFRPWLGGEELV
jgi:hypothetical protein